MNALLIFLYVLLVISSLFLILTVLMHKGKGGGVSDMFGGGLTQAAGSSGVAEHNLNVITIGTLVVWVTVIVAIGVLSKFVS